MLLALLPSRGLGLQQEWALSDCSPVLTFLDFEGSRGPSRASLLPYAIYEQPGASPQARGNIKKLPLISHKAAAN
jgi:hypothetical protein